MNVLSLFDGISCGRLALERAGVKVDGYHASEVDGYAIKIARKNYPDTVHLGDVRDVRGADLPKIDLLIGGSPCTGFSRAGKELNFEDPQSKLFFEYVRLLKETRPRWFMLENVKMKKEYRDIISSYLGVEPVEINSSLVAAQSRWRLYWTNIPFDLPEAGGQVLNDILEEDPVVRGGALAERFERHKTPEYSRDGLCHAGNADIKGNDCIKRVYHPEGKGPTLSTCQGGHREPKILYKDGWRKLTPLECERYQTVPDGWTEGVSNSQRYKCLGNGWTVDIVAHLFKGLGESMQ